MRGVLVCINVFVNRYIRFIKVIKLFSSKLGPPHLMIQATSQLPHPDLDCWRHYVENEPLVDSWMAKFQSNEEISSMHG